METRQLGTRGPRVSAEGFGCMGISQSYGQPDREGGIAAIRRALELGVTFFDTADVYGLGANEEVVGEALRPYRDQIVLASKCGLVRSSPDSPATIDGSPAHIREACDASLRRLGVKSLDLYYLHRVDPKTPIESSVEALAGLVHDGKVSHIGLSEVSPETLRRANSVHPITAVQSEYSLFNRQPEEGIIPVCRELGIGFVPFSPLGRGFLTGTVRSTDELPTSDFRRSLPRFQAGNVERNVALADRLGGLAKSKGCTTAQLALAWVLAQGQDIVPIPGTKRVKFVEENIAAATLKLSQSELAAIDAIFVKGAVAGERYSGAAASQVNR